MDFATAPRGELVILIYKQQQEIEILKGIIVDLQEKMKQRDSGDDSSKKNVPGFVKANVKKKKAKGKRKSRSHGFSRKRETPTQTVFHSFDYCPNCQTIDLGMPEVSYTRQIIDVPVISYEVVEHVVFKRYCFNCLRVFSPAVDFSSLVLGQGRIGINLMSQIFTMRQEEDMSIHQIQNHLRSIYSLNLSLGEIIEILHQESEIGDKAVEDIKQGLLSSKVIYADETGGRQDGKNGYFWSFSNQKYQLLIYKKSRAAKVVQGIVGSEGINFNGVMVTDFYTAYNEYLGPHQRCWVHYLRDLKKLVDDYPKDKKLKAWVKRIHNVYEEAKSYQGPPIEMKKGLAEEERMNQEQYFKNKLKAICEPYIKTDEVFAKLAARAIRYLSELFTFIRFAGVKPDNNMAERAVRKTVIQRKIWHGTRSQKGSHARSVLGSLFGTWRLQNLNPYEQMRLLLLKASRQEV